MTVYDTVMDTSTKWVCKICSRVHETRACLKIHLRRVHSIEYEQYVIETEYGGIRPKCACGCGQDVKFINGLAFSKLVKGHVTPEFRAACGDRFRGTTHTQAHRKAISQSSKAFYQTDEGKIIASERARKLLEFHASEKGTEWSRYMSQKLTEFNASEEGKKKNEKLSQTLLDIYASDLGKGLQEKISTRVNAFYASDAGAAFCARRSVEARAFYETPEGKASILEMAEKIRAKNRLPYSVVGERLTQCGFFEKLEMLTDLRNCYTGITMDVDVKCKTCSNIATRALDLVILAPHCLICDPVTVSKSQIEIFNFVNSLEKNVNLSDRSVISPYELDVYVPEKKFAVEFNGIYWHSQLAHTRDNAAQRKHELATAAGVKLMTVFEDEWRDNRMIVESMIRNRLGHSTNVIGARECAVCDLSRIDRQKFFKANHISGDVHAKFALGLRDKLGNVVAAMSCRVPFHKKHKNMLEVARFATVMNTSIPGALSKLTKYALLKASEQGYVGLLSYVDMRFGMGKSYEQIGYICVGTTQPRFWWTDFKRRFNRFACRATADASEDENARKKGWTRIFGCSNIVFMKFV